MAPVFDPTEDCEAGFNPRLNATENELARVFKMTLLAQAAQASFEDPTQFM